MPWAKEHGSRASACSQHAPDPCRSQTCLCLLARLEYPPLPGPPTPAPRLKLTSSASLIRPRTSRVELAFRPASSPRSSAGRGPIWHQSLCRPVLALLPLVLRRSDCSTPPPPAKPFAVRLASARSRADGAHHRSPADRLAYFGLSFGLVDSPAPVPVTLPPAQLNFDTDHRGVLNSHQAFPHPPLVRFVLIGCK
ncbi:hypothetical protein BCR34DRAFT_294943 [Clohesyomyces aquaticus]|uniref:Uncharacterized protein n=1 Tax=Clohesyomyces aquaticus TaxID=1231657 RepID=A0A1Y2A8H1_9PLEO|nr:hypothetical protein BCR34DRAFT_294943 [Clohesyomyces aquaticus]